MKFWIRVSPRGCVKSSLPDKMASSSDEAHELFTRDRAAREQEWDLGWRVKLVDEAAWDDRIRPCLTGSCVHRNRRESERGKPGTMKDRHFCPVCGHYLSSHDDGEPCGQHWDVCNAPGCAESRMDRRTRRERLQVLLSRMERGVILPEERKLLRAAVMAEVNDADWAYALVVRMKLESRR